MKPLFALALSLAAMGAQGADFGVHTFSVHAPARAHHQNDNFGLYLRGANWQAGAYRNSLDRTTAYAAYVYPVGPVDLMAGVVSGYSKRCTTTTTVTPKKVHHERMSNGDTGTTTYPEQTVTTEECRGWSRGALSPMAGVSYLAPIRVLGAAPRLFLAPGFGKASSVLNLSLEWSL